MYFICAENDGSYFGYDFDACGIAIPQVPHDIGGEWFCGTLEACMEYVDEMLQNGEFGDWGVTIYNDNILHPPLGEPDTDEYEDALIMHLNSCREIQRYYCKCYRKPFIKERPEIIIDKSGSGYWSEWS